MKFYIFVILFFAGTLYAQADEVVVTEVEKPYDVVRIKEDVNMKQFWLGELANYPVMYEIIVTSTTSLQLALRQEAVSEEVLPLSLLVVRQDNRGRGVTEVTRFKPKAEEWLVISDDELGMDFLESTKILPEIGPGTYRIEVSTPTNQAKYLLIIGQQSSSNSYLEILANTRTTQRFFGYSAFSMLRSPFIHYPLGIIVLAVGMFFTWRYRHKIKHVA